MTPGNRSTRQENTGTGMRRRSGSDGVCERHQTFYDGDIIFTGDPETGPFSQNSSRIAKKRLPETRYGANMRVRTVSGRARLG